MRFFAPLVTGLLALGVLAQTDDLSDNAILIPEGQSTLEVTAGEPLTIQWTNPTSGTVTIKLQQTPITPDGGIILASGIPASDETATLQIPDAGDVNSFQYTIQIVDDTDPTNSNYSPNFGIQGATGTATGSATGSATATETSTGTDSTSTGTETITSTDSTDTSSATTTDSSETDSTATATSTDDSSSSSSGSSTSSATSAAETTTAPNMAGSLKVQGSFLALAGALIAVM